MQRMKDHLLNHLKDKIDLEVPGEASRRSTAGFSQRIYAGGVWVS